MNCPICESLNISTYLKNLYDDRYGYPGFFDVLICNNCNHKWLNVKFNSKEIETLYTNFYPRSNLNIDDYKPLKFVDNFNSWLNGTKRSAYCYVPKNVRVLDIGCGFCETLGYHKERGCEVYGVEADLNAKKVADKFGFNVKIGTFDPNDYNESFFDYVTLDQVLEHFCFPIQMLNGIHKILKPDGKVIISTPNAESFLSKLLKKYWIHWHVPYHLHFFSKKSINIMASKTGFKVEKAINLTDSEWIYYQQIHLLIRPKPNLKAFFWNKDIKCNNIIIKILLKLLNYYHKTKINHLITRLLDFLNLGCNYVYILTKNK